MIQIKPTNYLNDCYTQHSDLSIPVFSRTFTGNFDGVEMLEEPGDQS